MWPAPGLVHPANLPQGSIWFPNEDAVNGAYLTSNPLTGSGTVTGLSLANPGAGYATAPTVTITGAGAATATAQTTGISAQSDQSYLVSRVS